MPMVASGMTEQEMVNRDTELVTVPEVTIGSFPVAVHSVRKHHHLESSDENVVFMDGWFVVKRQKDADINATITVTVTRPNNPEIQATRNSIYWFRKASRLGPNTQLPITMSKIPKVTKPRIC